MLDRVLGSNHVDVRARFASITQSLREMWYNLKFLELSVFVRFRRAFTLRYEVTPVYVDVDATIPYKPRFVR